MLGLIQVVTHAKVTVHNIDISSIQRGIVALIGIEKTDSAEHAIKLFDKIVQYRIFPDKNGKTNFSLLDIKGGLLLVPQFTLVADTQKGLRPSFSSAMPSEMSKKLFDLLVNYARDHYTYVAAGQFGAHMQVTLCNDGPVTFLLRG